MSETRARLPACRRLVVKIGSNALTQESGRFHRDHFAGLAADLIAAAEGRELVVVSSGAITLGVERLGLASRPTDIPGKQACAAVGQSRLVQAYEEAFAAHGRPVAQVLLTHGDIQDRRRYLNARHMLEHLLTAGVVPVINENDSVSVAELKFGDNDALAGLVAGLVRADLMVILSDVDGLYDRDPRGDPEARRLGVVARVTDEVRALAGGSASAVGTGGMATKVEAAARASQLGIATVIARGAPGGLGRVLAGDDEGTLFAPQTSGYGARWAWIAHALKPKGTLRVDAGALEALTRHHRSLLPSGLSTVEGDFERGEPVELTGPDGIAFARGLAAYSAHELRRIAGLHSSRIREVLGYAYLEEAVHRDDLAMLSAPGSRGATPS